MLGHSLAFSHVGGTLMGSLLTPKGAGRWLDWASCHILANAGSKPLLTPHLFILEIFNARLLFARHNLYPQEFVSREAARKEAQIAISCNECPKVGPVRAGE